jgi:hypothetical protein
VHAFHDDAWLALGQDEIYRIIDELEAPPRFCPWHGTRLCNGSSIMGGWWNYRAIGTDAAHCGQTKCEMKP